MERRGFLALCGATAATTVAGCTSGSPDDSAGNASPTDGPDDTDDGTPTTDDRTPTDREDPTTTPTPSGGVVSVSPRALQRGLVTLVTPDSIGIGSDAGQYLYLDVAVEAGTPPERSDFAFAFGGDTYAPVDPDSMQLWQSRTENAAYDADSGEGWLLFDLPASGDAAEARLTWANAEWRPDERLRQRLAALPPTLPVEVSIPESVERGADPTVSVTVTNEGDLPGRFVAGLNRSGPWTAYLPLERISFPVPPGESVTREYSDDSIHYEEADGFGDGEADMTYHLDWPGDRFEQDVRITE